MLPGIFLLPDNLCLKNQDMKSKEKNEIVKTHTHANSSHGGKAIDVNFNNSVKGKSRRSRVGFPNLMAIRVTYLKVLPDKVALMMMCAGRTIVV